MSFNNFYSNVILLLKLYILSLVVFFAFRISQLFYFDDLSKLLPEMHSLLKAFWFGFRFDTLVISYFLFPVLLLSIPLLFLSPETSYLRTSGKIISMYTVSILMLIIFILVVDFYYYKFFHAHFDNMFFGIFEDDTIAVIKSIWTDNPVILIFLALTIVTVLLRWYVQKSVKQKFSFPLKNLILKTLFVILLFGLFAFGMRGSLGTFPLGKDDMIICDNSFINDITSNGVFYLKESISDRHRYKIDNTIEPLLQKYHYASPGEAIAEYNQGECQQNDLRVCLEATTPIDTFLENNPPNIVFILMESMGTHYLSLHSPSLNLLGSLENELNKCILYKNFYPCANGTILSFEGILINSPSTPVSQSQYSTVPLKSSVALPYHNAGYETTYLTGGKLGWRKMGIYTLNQYFNAAEGNTEVAEKVPGAVESTWGVYDEFLFQRIYDKLIEDNKSGKPSFVFALTVSNHTPFELPDSYKTYPVSISEELKNKIKTTSEIAEKNFSAYQYSNHYLGELIRKIRNSELGKNTIIAITGDHNCRQLFEYSYKEIHDHYSVPFILYVPEKYLKNSTIDTTRIGSHKDIFPTLYNLSLSGVRYVKSGNNILTTDSTVHFFGVNEYNLGIDKDGAVFVNSNLRYSWIPGTKWFETTDTPERQDELYKLTRSQSFSMDYYVRSLLK